MRWLGNLSTSVVGWLRLATGWLRSKQELVRQNSAIPDLFRRVIIAEQDAARAQQQVAELQGELKATAMSMETLCRLWEADNAMLKESIAVRTYRAERRRREA